MHELRPPQYVGTPRRQAGTALFVSLISLVIMTLGAFALVRAIDTSTIIAGNVGFKQAALISTDAAIESAIQWIQANEGARTADVPEEGYYSTMQVDVNDFRNEVNWDGTNTGALATAKQLSTDDLGNQVSYVIHRICENPGAYSGTNQCLTYKSSETPTTSSHSSPSYTSGPGQNTAPTLLYYRVTLRVTGPRNTLTFVQAVFAI